MQSVAAGCYGLDQARTDELGQLAFHLRPGLIDCGSHGVRVEVSTGMECQETEQSPSLGRQGLVRQGEGRADLVFQP